MNMTDSSETPEASDAGAKNRREKPARGAVRKTDAAEAKARKASKTTKAPKVAKAPKVGKTPTEPVSGPAEGGSMKSKEFMNRVLARSGASRAVAKPVVDAVLAELAALLARGEGFSLQSLGHGKLRPAKEGKSPKSLTLRLRLAGTGKSAKAAGAD